MKFPVLDLHCDTVSELMGSDLSGSGNLRKNDLHIDLERGKGLPGYAQCFAFWSTTGMTLPKGVSVQDMFWRQVSFLQDSIDKNSDLIRQARSAAEIRKNCEAGKISAIFTIEGPANIDFDPGKLEKLRNLGFCMSTLSWNEKNPLTGSCSTGGGLTRRGMEYVREAQRLGIVVDVSHISDQAFWDIMDITQAPIVASHSNSRRVCDHKRNLTDDMFRAVCATGGVAGLNQYAYFLGCEPDLDKVCDHVFHFLDLDPDGTHIALGADFDGCDKLAREIEGLHSYPLLARRLLERGLDEQTLHNIFWNNALGVIETCCI